MNDAKNYQVHNRIPNRQLDHQDIKFRRLYKNLLRIPEISPKIHTVKKERKKEKKSNKNMRILRICNNIFSSIPITIQRQR